MSLDTSSKLQFLRGILTLTVVLSALCTIFAAVVTAAQASQERAQASWPEATAQVVRCYMHQTSTGRRNGYYIDCLLSYAVDDGQNQTHIYSRTVPGATVAQYPPNQIAPFEEWVDAHPAGTPITIRYNPADHTKVVLVDSDMPGAGPHTPGNIKQVEFWGGSFLVLLFIVRITKPRGDSNAFVERTIN